MTEFYEYSVKEEDEWNLKQFFHNFRDKLPQLVIVTGGDYGPTQFDDLSNDQVIRYHKFYAQKRVVAKPPHGPIYLSIPVDGPYTFKVIKRKKDVKVQNMADLLETNEMPFLVVFESPLDDFTLEKNDDGTKKAYLIIGTHIEYFLQGNCLQDDEMAINPTVNCLSENIFVTPITGIKGRSKDEFKRFLVGLNKMAKKVVYLPQQCDLSIKQYEKKDELIKNLIEESDQEIEIPNEPPPPLPKRNRSIRVQDDDEYETLDEPLKPPSKSLKNVGPFKKTTLIDPRKNLPELKTEDLSNPTKPNYENDILCQVKPTPHIAPKDTTKPSPVYEQINTPVDLRSLKIEDVTKILSKLKLDKYKETFEDNMIDGEYLVDIDMSILVGELGFSRLEALRLRKYVEKGHIPE